MQKPENLGSIIKTFISTFFFIFQLIGLSLHTIPHSGISSPDYSIIVLGHEFQNKWSLFDTYLTNIELIPYHSEGISLPSQLSEDQLNYLTTRFKNSVNFIVKHRPKLFVFNGNPWYVLLIKHSLIDDYEKVPVTSKFNLYFFKLQNIPCVLFDKFFQRHFWGITDYDRKFTIPTLIKKRYQL